MKKTLSVLLLSILSATLLHAQEQKTSPVSLSLELTSKYMWRGIEYGTSPVLFPALGFAEGGFAAYAMGGYATNGSHQEVDWGLSYTWKDITLAFNDYFYPTAVGAADNYFNLKSHETGHWWEATLGWSPEHWPFWVLLSTYIGGADKNLDGKQAYSSYAEVGGYYDFTADDRLSLALGSSLNTSFYTDYACGGSIVNIDLKYAHTAHLGSLDIPLSASWIYNPYKDKTYLTFSAAISF